MCCGCRQVIEAGSPLDVRSFLESQEREAAPLLSGFPLHEPLFQLMCHPVPNSVKAALDQVRGGCTWPEPGLGVGPGKG